MEKPTWRATALAMATAALLGVASMDANALALGRVTVQSALGEPLRAEIDIVEITPEELASLQSNVAPPEAFRAAGLEFSPALTNVQVTLQKRANGRPFLLLTSQRPVNDPFIDLILETQWASGRIVRDYTMLFDPPQLRRPSEATAGQIAPATPAAPAARSTTDPQPSASARAATGPRSAPPVARTAPVAPRAMPAPGPAAAPAADGEPGKVTVQKGDWAGKIAAAHKPANVSLDQMLMALLQANPQAFSGSNVNRLKAGAVLQIPTAEQAGQQPAGESTRAIIAQSRDFNEFRRRLAEGVATAPVAGSDRQASGKLQAQVQDKTPAAATPDKLTLSKGAVQGKSAAEDKIAREREASDAATRLAELNKNIADLNRLSSATPAAPAPATAGKPASAPAAPGLTLPAAGTASAVAPAVQQSSVAAAPAASSTAPAAPVATASSAPAPADAAASAPSPVAAATASAPLSAARPASAPAAAAAAKPKAAVAPLPVSEPSLLEELLDNPLVLAAGAAAVLLLGGLGFYRIRQRKKSPQVDSSFLESRLQPDSFFGASGGQRIDTNEGSATGSSMVYSPSQLDAAGDVDPVAEADVYLAYGRDLQAEEILKEALRISPQRVAIHSKLLEIYAKRRDAKAFEVAATEAYSLTGGEGPEWEHICDLGRELDGGNPMYRPGGHPSGAVPLAASAATAAAASTLDSPASTSADVDLDLDFSLGDEPSASAAQTTGPVNIHTPPEPLGGLDLEFDGHQAPEPAATAPVSFELPIEAPAEAPKPVAPAIAAAPDLELHDNALSFDLDEPPAAAPVPPPVAASPAPAAADAKMIEFDLGELSLDLDSPAAPAPAAAAVAPAATTAVAPAAAAEPEPLTLPKTEKFRAAAEPAELSTQGLEDGGGDPLATKFALAQEFNAIGDPDGARSLAEEVLAEASGDLKSRAQKFLAEIG